jgi:hypothetical protein
MHRGLEGRTSAEALKVEALAEALRPSQMLRPLQMLRPSGLMSRSAKAFRPHFNGIVRVLWKHTLALRPQQMLRP